MYKVAQLDLFAGPDMGSVPFLCQRAIGEKGVEMKAHSSPRPLKKFYYAPLYLANLEDTLQIV